MDGPNAGNSSPYIVLRPSLEHYIRTVLCTLNVGRVLVPIFESRDGIRMCLWSLRAGAVSSTSAFRK